MLAPGDVNHFDAYPFTIEPENGMLIVRLGELIATVVSDVAGGTPIPTISGRFHRTVAEIIARACRIISEKTGITSVALSGGVFQNRLLFNLAIDGLEKEGLKVFSHQPVPCNHGGIALGQAVIAHFSRR